LGRILGAVVGGRNKRSRQVAAVGRCVSRLAGTTSLITVALTVVTLPLPLRRSLALGWRCGEGAAAVGGPDGVSVDFGHIPGTLLRLGIVPILSAAFGC